MPVAAANPGLLTLSFLEISSGSAGGVILNEDGTLNDVQNPAACGSTITIYATGLSGDHAALRLGVHYNFRVRSESQNGILCSAAAFPSVGAEFRFGFFAHEPPST